MDLRQIRYFVAVAESLHFGRAAERMNVVQSAISQQIKVLEVELGVTLLERSRPNVRLTESGRMFLPECRRMLLQADEAVRVARQAASGRVGRVRVSFVDNALWSLLPPLIRAFRDRYPAVELELLPLDRSAQIKALEDRAIDAALLPTPDPLGDFQTEIFAEGSLVVALPIGHPLLARARLSVDTLADHAFVMFPPDMHSRLNDIVLGACSTAGFVPKVAQEAAQMHTQLALVAAGFGLSIVPRWVAATHFKNVRYRPLTRPALNYGLSFVWRRDSDNRALRNFTSVVRDVAVAYRKARRGGPEAAAHLVGSVATLSGKVVEAGMDPLFRSKTVDAQNMRLVL